MNENIDAKPAEDAYPETMETTADVTPQTDKLEDTEAEDGLGRQLTKHDRCDRCGAEALGYAARGDQDMLFCGHHLNKYEPALAAQGFEVYQVKTLN